VLTPEDQQHVCASF